VANGDATFEQEIFNTRRRQSFLGGISPLAFEAKVA
jgi:hypothetical protein